ncbi:unnamed protein product, partial [Callosobruchus maculatus]
MEATPYFTLYLLYLSAFLLAYIVLDVYLKAEIYTFAKKIHGPKAYPIIGTNYVFYADKKNYLRALFSIFEEYKLPVSLWNGNQYEYWTSNVNEIEEILTNDKMLDKGNGYSKLALYLGDSLLVVSDRQWELHRNLLTKCFEPDVLKRYITVFYDRSCELADKIAGFCDENPAQLVLRCTANMFFGTAGLGNIIDLLFVQRILKASEHSTEKMHNPFSANFYYYHFNPQGRTVKHNLTFLKNYAKRIVAERKSKIAKLKRLNNGSPTDYRPQALLDIIIETGLSVEAATNEMILFAGETSCKTTPAFLSACVLLSMHPDIQDHVYKEIIEVVGEYEEITYENVKSLELTERVILESLRICPIMFSLTRYTKERVRIGRRIIPAGCHMKIFVYDVHHQEKYWPDPRKFDPDRFLPENVSQRNRYSFLAFSDGPRNCLGKCKRATP